MKTCTDFAFDPFTPFSCPRCQIRFKLTKAEEPWDQELEFDFSAWLAHCASLPAKAKGVPGACEHLAIELAKRNC